MNRICFGVFLALHLAAYVRNGAAQEQQSLTLLEGNSLSLSCPSRVSFWFFEQFPQSASIVVRYDEERQRYVGSEEQRDVRVNAATVRVNGSPLVLLQSAPINAGVYGCQFRPSASTSVQVRLWDVAVVSKHRTKLSFAVDDEAFKSNLWVARDVHEGSTIATTCVASYAGFHDPGLELVLIDVRGNRRVLAASTPSINSTFSSSAVSQVSAEYRVQPTDCSFHIQCLIADDARSTIASQLFEQNLATCPLTDLHRGYQPSHLKDISAAAIVLMLVIVVLVFAITVYIMKLRKMRPLDCLRRHSTTYPADSDECFRVELPPSYPDVVPMVVARMPGLPPSYSELLQAEASPGRPLHSPPLRISISRS